MTEIVKVTTADVERAQLVVKLNDYVGKPTSEAIRRIAAATPFTGSPRAADGHTDGRTNGHRRPEAEPIG